MIEDAVMNATKNMLIEDLLPEVSLKCNDEAKILINAKDAKINDLEEKLKNWKASLISCNDKFR